MFKLFGNHKLDLIFFSFVSELVHFFGSTVKQVQKFPQKQFIRLIRAKSSKESL